MRKTSVESELAALGSHRRRCSFNWVILARYLLKVSCFTTQCQKPLNLQSDICLEWAHWLVRSRSIQWWMKRSDLRKPTIPRNENPPEVSVPCSPMFISHSLLIEKFSIGHIGNLWLMSTIVMLQLSRRGQSLMHNAKGIFRLAFDWFQC